MRKVPFSKIFKTFFVFLAFFGWDSLNAQCLKEPTPLLLMGSGRFYGKHKNTRWLIEAEYKWGKSWWYIRPLTGFMTPAYRSLYLYSGIAFEFHLMDHLVLSPNFSPGVYIRGNGKDLGFPIEFRSCFEIAYEFDMGARIGGQYYHLSNASLSSRNPGANSWSVFVAFPFSCKSKKARFTTP